MTATTTAPIAASRVLSALEAAWRQIMTCHPDVPPVVIILASGTSGKHPKWGHHAPQRWHAGEQDHTEIMISGEGLRRPASEVLATLLHEATHALAVVRDIKDTSRQGRYHNTHFKVLAGELGITVTHVNTIGWSVTSLPADTARTYRQQITALSRAMVLYRHDEAALGGAARTSANLIAATCPCDRTIRIAASVLTDAPVTCGACGGDFTAKEGT